MSFTQGRERVVDRIDALKFEGSVGRGVRWGAEEDEHYMRLVKEERAKSPHIDATSRESFWIVVQKRLAESGFTRSVYSLRSRWNFKLCQSSSTGEDSKKGFDTGAVTAVQDNRTRHTRRIDSDEEDGYDYLADSSATRLLRKRRFNSSWREIGYVNSQNADFGGYETVLRGSSPPTKRVRVDSGLEFESEPRNRNVSVHEYVNELLASLTLT